MRNTYSLYCSSFSSLLYSLYLPGGGMLWCRVNAQTSLYRKFSLDPGGPSPSLVDKVGVVDVRQQSLVLQLVNLPLVHDNLALLWHSRHVLSHSQMYGHYHNIQWIFHNRYCSSRSVSSKTKKLWLAILSLAINLLEFREILSEKWWKNKPIINGVIISPPGIETILVYAKNQ